MNTYTKTEKNLYLVGLVGQNIIYAVISSLFAYYIQFTLLIPAYAVGFILTSARIFDAFKDLFIGSFISKKHLKSGRMKPYLIYLPIPTAIVTVICFLNRLYNSSSAITQFRNFSVIAFVFIVYLLWEIIFAFGDISIAGFPTLLTESEEDKNALLALRPIGTIAASITALIAQPLAFSIGARLGSEQKGFIAIAAILSLIGGLLFQLTAIRAKERVGVTAETKQSSFSYFIKNEILRKVFISGMLGSAKGTTAIVITPLISYYYASKDPLKTFLYTFLLGMGSFLGMIISMTLVPKLKKKYSSRKIFIYSNFINAAPNSIIFILYLLNRNSMAQFFPLAILILMMTISGSCNCISNTVQTMLLSEAVDLEKKKSGNRPEALFFSCNTFIIKVASGVSSFVVSIGYNIINFSSSQTEMLNELISSGVAVKDLAAYSPLMTVLFFMLTIPVAVSSILCIIPFLKKQVYKF